MKTKMMIVFLLIGAVMLSTGCMEEELTKYEKPYVVGERSSLPYYESAQEYNPAHVEELLSQLASYDNDVDESYLLVDNEGKVMNDEEFARNRGRSFSEELAFIDKIKNYPLFIVKKDFYYVTTVEEEIKALFEGERLLFDQSQLAKIIEDNKEAYENKDYETILSYLRRNGIKVWKQYVSY